MHKIVKDDTCSQEETIFHKMLDFSVLHSRSILAVAAVLTVFFGFFITRLNIDPDVASLIPANEKISMLMDKYGELDEEEDYLALAVSSKQPLNAGALQCLGGRSGLVIAHGVVSPGMADHDLELSGGPSENLRRGVRSPETRSDDDQGTKAVGVLECEPVREHSAFGVAHQKNPGGIDRRRDGVGGIHGIRGIRGVVRVLESGGRLKTFNVRFPGVGYFDESEPARRVAEWLGSDHYVEDVQPDAASILDDLIHHFDHHFQRIIERLTPKQISFLKAMVDGNLRLYSEAAL